MNRISNPNCISNSLHTQPTLLPPHRRIMVSQANRVPVSQLLHDAANEDGSSQPVKKSREDWRRAKELEEARKAGTAPAAVDEDGRDINPHIPQYISNAPWYYNAEGPTLRHQRPQEEKHQETSTIDEWYKRGVDKTQVHTKFRKGSCENCGAITHKKLDCLERPRKIGAKYTGAQIAFDDFLQPKITSDFDGKRDRWAGYDPNAHREIVEEYQKVEEAKQKIKADKLKDNPDAELSDEETNEDKYVDEVDMPGTKVDSKQRITVRNLRIREDTAKYLRNLDPNSAYYDPKTRSMRDNPNPSKNPNESEFAGENYVRFSGDTTKHSQAQIFAWEAYGKGVDVHLLAEPTKLELLQHEYEKKKEQFKSETKNTILDTYGGEEHLEAPPKSLLLAQSEEYVEYSRSGKVIRGQEKLPNRSIYEEDIRINNHTTTWGSWWTNGTWGYKCCHSCIKNSYCVGDTDGSGQLYIPDSVHTAMQTLASTRIATNNQRKLDDEQLLDDKSSDAKQLTDEQQETIACVDNPIGSSGSHTERKKKKSKKNKKTKRKQTKKTSKKSKNVSSDDDDDDEETTDSDAESNALKKALRAEEAHHKRVDKLMAKDERKRPYNSMYEVKQPSENEIEAYLIKRRRDDDPMAQFV